MARTNSSDPPAAGRARQLGRRRRLSWGSVATILVVVALLVAGLLAGLGVFSQSRSALVGYPSWLPNKTLHPDVDAVLTGTSKRPALTVEGLGVKAITPHWSVLIDVSGPVVPGEGLPYQPTSTTCTWTITMSQATGRVPISLADFNSVDHLGRIFPMVFVEDQPRPPAVLLPREKVTFEVRSYETVGEGIMRWAPIGKKIVAMWDYEVEND